MTGARPTGGGRSSPSRSPIAASSIAAGPPFRGPRERNAADGVDTFLGGPGTYPVAPPRERKHTTFCGRRCPPDVHGRDLSWPAFALVLSLWEAWSWTLRLARPYESR